jgi:hypothetical protein
LQLCGRLRAARPSSQVDRMTFEAIQVLDG